MVLPTTECDSACLREAGERIGALAVLSWPGRMVVVTKPIAQAICSVPAGPHIRSSIQAFVGHPLRGRRDRREIKALRLTERRDTGRRSRRTRSRGYAAVDFRLQKKYRVSPAGLKRSAASGKLNDAAGRRRRCAGRRTGRLGGRHAAPPRATNAKCRSRIPECALRRRRRSDGKILQSALTYPVRMRSAPTAYRARASRRQATPTDHPLHGSQVEAPARVDPHLIRSSPPRRAFRPLPPCARVRR